VGSGHVDPVHNDLAHDLTRGFKQQNFWVMETQLGAGESNSLATVCRSCSTSSCTRLEIAARETLAELSTNDRSERVNYLDANAPACERPVDGGSVISIAQIAAGRMYIEARKLPSISYASGDRNQYPLVS
jgi:hypothetical protein